MGILCPRLELIRNEPITIIDRIDLTWAIHTTIVSCSYIPSTVIGWLHVVEKGEVTRELSRPCSCGGWAEKAMQQAPHLCVWPKSLAFNPSERGCFSCPEDGPLLTLPTSLTLPHRGASCSTCCWPRGWSGALTSSSAAAEEKGTCPRSWSFPFCCGGCCTTKFG